MAGDLLKNDIKKEQAESKEKQNSITTPASPDPDDDNEKHKGWKEQQKKLSDKELQKGINSFEKQIELHKDKINNPEKYYPEWNSLNQKQREALINNKWPSDIKRQEEQKKILEEILKSRGKK